MSASLDIDQIVCGAIDVSVYLNHAARRIEDIEDEDQRKELRKCLGEAMGRIYADILLPIYDYKPELRRENVDYDSVPP